MGKLSMQLKNTSGIRNKEKLETSLSDLSLISGSVYSLAPIKSPSSRCFRVVNSANIENDVFGLNGSIDTFLLGTYGAFPNLILDSENPANATWGKDHSGSAAPTLTVNYELDPFGRTLTAFRMQASQGSNFSRLQQPLVLSLIPTVFSFWAKSNTGSTQNVSFRIGASNLNIDITTTWTRFERVVTPASVSDSIQVMTWLSQLNTPSIDISLWGFVVHAGSTYLGYSKTGSGIVSGVLGLHTLYDQGSAGVNMTSSSGSRPTLSTGSGS
jgi:hypothetical protein